MSLEAFIRNALTRLPPDRMLKFDKTGAWIRCPFHGGGMEKTPSLHINLSKGKGIPPGVGKCFGCNYKISHWNQLADLFNLSKLSEGRQREASAVIMRMAFGDDEPEPPDYEQFMPWPEIKWRSIEPDILRKYNARAIKFGKESMMYLPVVINDENVGGINCRIDRDYNDKQQKAYINTTGPWSGKSLVGYDQAASQEGPLWVVEGPRDVLKTAQNGGRAVGLIGSSVTKEKLGLILDLDPPSVLVATDPDPAGDGAAEKLFAGLERHLPVKRYKFKEGSDPACLEPKQVKRAIEKMIGLYGEGG